jgi:predicted DNA-binding transcriptional regulator YafY
MRLLGSLKSLITEAASIDDIKKSIEQKQVCSIYYEGDEPGGRGLREIEPVALGRSKAGNLVLRGWDRTGASHTAYKGEQPLPSWRLFRVDKITMLKPTRENFTQAQPGYNFNGDKSMTQVIVIAKFDNTTTISGGKKNYGCP